MAYCLPPRGIQRLEVSQISLQLMRVRSLSRGAKAAFEPGDTTDISMFSMQLLETAQEKIQSGRHCPRPSPLVGFLPITPGQSKVILPCLRSAAWDVPSQKSLPCLRKTQAEVGLFSDICYHKPDLMQGLGGGSITLRSGNLESNSLSLGLAKFLSHQKLARELICPKECYPDTDQQQLYFYIQTYLY